MNQDLEIWENIKGYEDFYQVSNLGRVKSLDRTILRSDSAYCLYKGTIRKFQHSSNVYLELWLCKDGFHHLFKVHLLVANAFLQGTFVKHIDGNKYNNRADNLGCCTD